MTQRYLELLKSDCQKYVLNNSETCKKWGQTTQTIFDFMFCLSRQLQEGGCSQRYIQEFVRKELTTYIEIVKKGKTPEQIANEYLVVKTNNESKSEMNIEGIDESIFKKKVWDKDEDERLIKLLLMGISSDKIAKFLHTTTSTIDCRVAYLKKKHLW